MYQNKKLIAHRLKFQNLNTKKKKKRKKIPVMYKKKEKRNC